ncbi:MAG: ATP-binding protein [Candidatus Sumerlaeota bacterium]|nr:ATP-binding protein [Candidatus Sumerlaeota bacterium]
MSYVGAREKPSAVLDAERLGMLEVVAEPYDLLVSLRVIDPRITRIRTITVGQIPVIHGDVGLGRMLPLTLLGEGLQRMASLLLAIATTAGGIVLIDEIENGLHHSVLPKVWRAIADAAKRFDVQVFATTHSYECIGAAHAAFEAQSDYDFRLHRLESIKGEVKAISYDRETLGVAMDAYMEVR